MRPPSGCSFDVKTAGSSSKLAVLWVFVEVGLDMVVEVRLAIPGLCGRGLLQIARFATLAACNGSVTVSESPCDPLAPKPITLG